MEINGRLLGDGARSAHAPIFSAFAGLDDELDLLCFVVDAFSTRADLRQRSGAVTMLTRAARARNLRASW